MAAPFLDLDARSAYLVAHGYTPVAPSDDAMRFLRRTNFHYFLGYTGNYRALARSGLAPDADAIDACVDLVRLDHQVSTLVFAAVKELEWQLRASFVERHCADFDAVNSYLNPDHYSEFSLDDRPTHTIVKQQTLRTSEPWFIQQFERHDATVGQADRTRPGRMPDAIQDAVLADIPVWAVVDSWSFGLLTRVITTSVGQEGCRPLWKSVAIDFEVKNAIFIGQLQGLNVLRNLVAHHARLWMRPTAQSPKLPDKLEKRSRRFQPHPKSMYVACLALAEFLVPSGKAEPFLHELEAYLDANDVYQRGFCRPVGNRV